MHQVLDLANKRELARRLSARGYKVSGETLARWARNAEEVDPRIEAAILELFGLVTKETAPPWWGEAASDLIARIEERMSAIAESAVAQQSGLVRQSARDLVAELEAEGLLDVEAPPVESPAPQGTGSKRGRQSR